MKPTRDLVLTNSSRVSVSNHIICCEVQATGAYTTSRKSVSPPSFVLIDVQGNKMVTYSYILDKKVWIFGNNFCNFVSYLLTNPLALSSILGSRSKDC